MISYITDTWTLADYWTAKKLKKAWIEKTKIRTKWKAEKRKLQADGVLPVTRKPWEIQEEAQSGPGRPDDERSSHSDSESEPSHRTPSHSEERPLPPHLRRPTSPKPRRPDGTQNSTIRRTKEEPQSSKEQSRWADKGKSKANPQQDTDEPESEQTPSLRDLKREAYSRTNLHSFKADPLHKHAARRGQPPNQRGRGNGPGRGEAGRGQPNMKLRMDYMLERIKKDFS